MQLLRILLDLPLGSTALTSPGVMLNLLGEPGFIGTTKYEGVDEALAIEGVKLHFTEEDLDAIKNNVVSGFSGFSVSTMCVPSTFETKCMFKRVLYGANASETM